jgi:hypothetical protein
MNFSKSLMETLNDVIYGITNSHGVDFDQFVESNKELIINTLQTINDYDLETYVHSSIFTLFLISDPEQEVHVNNWKNFIFGSISLSNEHYQGDIEEFFKHGGFTPFMNDETDDESDEEEEESNLIPDEVYGEVNPEDLEHLKTCFSL